MGLELRIDIYSICIIIVTFFLFLFLISKQIKLIRDKELQTELDRILKKYVLGVVDEGWIIWAPIFTIFYSFYIVLKLCLKRRLGKLIKAFWDDKLLVLMVSWLVSFWIILTLLALFQRYFIYALIFVTGSIFYMLLNKKIKEATKEVIQ